MDKLTGHDRPHAHLVGEVGQHYEDLDTGDIYECRIASQYSPTHGWPVGGYVWELRAKGEDREELYGGDIIIDVSSEKVLVDNQTTSWSRSDKPGIRIYDVPEIVVGKSYKLVMTFTMGGSTLSVNETVTAYTGYGVTMLYEGVIPNEDATVGVDYKDGQLDAEILDGTNMAGEVTISLYELTNSTTVNPIYLPKAAAVADVTAAPTANEFNALLASLRAAGYLAT